MNHLPSYMPTAKFYMNHIRNNIKSTKTQGTPPNKDKTMETLDTRSNHVFAKKIDPQQRISIDLTRIFLVTYNRGNKYLFILYDYDRNYIMVGPIKKRTDK